MNFSIDWSELSLQLVLTFGHFLWQACVVGVLLEVALRLVDFRSRQPDLVRGASDISGIRESKNEERLARPSASMNYLLACACFFVLPLCALVTLGWVHQSRGNIWVAGSEAMSIGDIPAADARVLDVQLLPETALTSSTNDPSLIPNQKTAMLRNSLDKLAPLSVDQPVSPPTWIEQLQPFAPSLLIGYLAGAGLLLVRFGMSLIGSVRLRRGLEMVTDSQLLAVIAEQSQRLGLRQEPIVALCHKVNVPVVVGILKPMILFPPALITGLGIDQLAAIISHEMAHIRRYDLLVNLMQRVVEALLFFHPVTWWISRRVSIERENCCDDLAAGSTGSLSYVDALLKMAEVCLSSDPRRKVALTSLAASGSGATQLGYRIRRLIGAEQPSRIGWSQKAIGATLVMMLLTGVSLAALVHKPAIKMATAEGISDESLPTIIPVSELEDQTGNEVSASSDGAKSESYELSFVPVDTHTRKLIRNAAILYSKRELSWRPLQLYRDGESTIEADVTQKLIESDILIFAEGYEQVQLKLDTRLELGKPLVKRVEMKAVPPVKFMLTDSKGKPAPYAKIELMKNGDLRQALSRRRHGFPSGFLNIRVQSDENGVVQFPRPAFAQWTTYRFTHKAGFVDIPGRNLPKPLSQRKIRLTPYSGFKGRYLPEIKQNEFLEAYRLESNRLSIVGGRNEKMLVSDDGKFQLTGLLAGWHSFVHRIRYTDRNGRSGTRAIAIYGPFELQRGQIWDLDLGNSTRSVSGLLKLPANVDRASVTVSLSGVGVGFPGYPMAPAELSTEDKRHWWEIYWRTNEGKQYRNYRQRNLSVPVSADGRFHFPSLPVGAYSLRILGEQERSAGANFVGRKRLQAEINQVTVPKESSSHVVDLGEIVVSLASQSGQEKSRGFSRN